ncbi:hypothetical protein Angca_009049, partial [Angiostrongylus cantonensis]
RQSSKYHQVWGEGSVDESTARTWFWKFRSDDFDLEVKERQGHPNELDDDEFKALVEANTRTTVRELAQKFGLSLETISTHLNRL